MRITRFHLLLAFLGLVCAGYGTFVWMQNRSLQAHVVQERPVAALPPQRLLPPKPARIASVAPANDEMKRKAVARSVANVGEAYQLVRKRMGEVPSVSHPLRSAKSDLAAGQYDQAMASAKEAWVALKNVAKNGTPLSETYEVARGDTLWRIARDHSPVHQGPGWVAIWRANKKTVKNFDRLEVGWTLKIPTKRSQYVMRYWKPRQVALGIIPAKPAPARHVREQPVSSPATLTQLLFFDDAERPGVTAALEIPSISILAQAQYH